MAKFLEIAFAFPTGSLQEVFIEGVIRYASEHDRSWSYMLAPESNSISICQLIGWPGHGVIAALNTTAYTRCAKSFPIPVVNMSSALQSSPVPRSIVDNHAIGVMAAEHFRERGYENLGFYGLAGIAYSQRRLDGFAESLASSNLCPQVHLAAPTFTIAGSDWLQQQAKLTAWIQELPLPIGILAASDARARQLLNSCRQLGLHVPDQVAVMGVDDQQIICEHYHPTISSIARNSVQEGYEAARLLDCLLERRKLKQREILIPPHGVVTRESTDTVAAQDERLRDAFIYCRENIESQVSVDDICRHAGVSRRWLEYAFREQLGISPFNYIRRQRLRHAKTLLRDEHRTPIKVIARRTGYASANQLAKAFRAEFSQTPRDFRRSVLSG
jgi:LacI family transcriptional regulator